VSAVIDLRSTPARPRPRPARSRIAQPLIMSLGVLTFLVSGAYVAMAATATGSARPQDWVRLDWAAVGGHYQLCVQRDGSGALGCLLSASARPVAASAPAGAVAPRVPPIYSVAVVPVPAAAPAARTPARRAAAAPASHAPASHAVAATTGPPVGAAAPARLVQVPANATHDQIVAACQAATRAAQAQGPAAIQEVQRECAALLGQPGGDD
jgi:hypothetical protein